MKNIPLSFKPVQSTFTENMLNFRLTVKNGNYGIIFHGHEAIAYAMFNKKNKSLAVAFKKSKRDKYSKKDIVLTMLSDTNVFYGLHDYRVTENDNIFKAHNKRFNELNN